MGGVQINGTDGRASAPGAVLDSLHGASQSIESRISRRASGQASHELGRYSHTSVRLPECVGVWADPDVWDDSGASMTHGTNGNRTLA